jgi:hypothetical protein
MILKQKLTARIADTYMAVINEFKWSYQPRNNLLKDEIDDMLAD